MSSNCARRLNCPGLALDDSFLASVENDVPLNSDSDLDWTAMKPRWYGTTFSTTPIGIISCRDPLMSYTYTSHRQAQWRRNRGSVGSMNWGPELPKERAERHKKEFKKNNRPGRRTNAIIAITCVTKMREMVHLHSTRFSTAAGDLIWEHKKHQNSWRLGLRHRRVGELTALPGL